MAERLILIPVRTSKQGITLNAGKLEKEYCEETSTVELHRQDMAKWGLKKGDKIRLRSNGIEAIVTCKERKGDDATPGLAFIAYGPVTSQFMEADTAGTGMPASKHLEVEIEGPVGDDGQLITARPAVEQALAAPCPLTPAQLAALEALMRAPLTPTQAAWLSGYFAALSGAQPLAAAQPTASLPLMTILYGSHTGNGEGIAETLMEKATAEGINARLCDMEEFDPLELEREQLLFVIVSTHGEGDPPISAKHLHAYLKDYSGPPLAKLKYAVFALGDSSYQFFCQTGKDFDHYLETAGATRILDRVDADVDFEQPAQDWMDQVIKLYWETANVSKQPSKAQIAPAAKKTGYSKTNPYPAQVMVNLNLNGQGSAKETRHLEIDLGDSGLSYEPGDALGVYPENNPRYVEDLLAALGLSGEEQVALGKETVDLRRAFTNMLDITALSQPLIAKYAALIASESLKALLEDEKAYNEYAFGRQILDLVKEYPPRGISAQQFVDLLRKIPPRLYSIASSLKAYPGQAHLLVAVVRYRSFGRDREGVCSNYLARAQVGERLPVYVQANKHFRLPESGDVPIIMVGPGTGLAPFRAYLQERRANGSRGKNWLFFGDQHRATDFLYGEELMAMHRDGFLTRLDLAFSRDQERKIYVQHRMLENSKELYGWLEEGAYFYVCGDASRMAKDVHQALLEVIAKEGGKTDPQEYVDGLVAAKRYLQDVY